jgi:hypothetical protein
MPDAPPTSSLSAYQLRVVLRGVSPLIWRRLLVPGDSSIADLHATLQLAFGWSDEHLNRFVIHGREYGVAHPGGLWFRNNPLDVHGVDLGLRLCERFLDEYDFFDGWSHDIGWRRSCRSSRLGATRCAPAAAARLRSRDAAGRGPSWSSASTTRRSGSSSCWRCSSRRTPISAARFSAIAPRSSKAVPVVAGRPLRPEGRQPATG